MKRRLLAVFMTLAIVLGCTACRKETPKDDRTIVGISMPTHSSKRWLKEGYEMKNAFEKLGYAAELYYAEDDSHTQIEQIKSMIDNGAKCLVIAALDSVKLIDVLSEARQKDVNIIAYDRLLMGTNAVDYFIGYDNKLVGRQIAEYIEEKKALKTAAAEKRSYSFELFMGSLKDNNSQVTYEGIMEVLKPYIDQGILICKSNELSLEETALAEYDEQTASKRLKSILEKNYADSRLDIIVSGSDECSLACTDVLKQQGYQTGSDWPLITGREANAESVKAIINGTQSMSVFTDIKALTEKCVKTADDILNGKEPKADDITKCYNGQEMVDAYLYTSNIVDSSNYKTLLIDNGYYTKQEVGIR